MPDIDFSYVSPRLIKGERFHTAANNDHPLGLTDFQLRQKIRLVVAEQMGCLDDNGREIRHTPGQIVFTSFNPLWWEEGDKLIFMRVHAYDWPDRMRNMDERLRAIGLEVWNLLNLPSGSVDVNFVEQRHPTPQQPPTWVNV